MSNSIIEATIKCCTFASWMIDEDCIFGAALGHFHPIYSHNVVLPFTLMSVSKYPKGVIQFPSCAKYMCYWVWELSYGTCFKGRAVSVNNRGKKKFKGIQIQQQTGKIARYLNNILQKTMLRKGD